MTRSIGDMVAGSVGVVCDPEIQVFSDLNDTDRAIVIATDGLWDRLSNQEIKEIVMSKEFYEKRDAEGAI